MYATAGLGLGVFAVPIVSIFLVECLGRRFPLLFGLYGTIIALGGMFLSTLFSTEFYPEKIEPIYSAVAFLVLFVIMYSVFAALPIVITAELYDQRVRSLAVTFATISMTGISAVLTFAYLPFKNAVGISYSFIPFLVVTSVCTIYLHCRLPETRGKTILEISDRD